MLIQIKAVVNIFMIVAFLAIDPVRPRGLEEDPVATGYVFEKVQVDPHFHGCFSTTIGLDYVRYVMAKSFKQGVLTYQKATALDPSNSMDDIRQQMPFYYKPDADDVIKYLRLKIELVDEYEPEGVGTLFAR